MNVTAYIAFINTENVLSSIHVNKIVTSIIENYGSCHPEWMVYGRACRLPQAGTIPNRRGARPSRPWYNIYRAENSSFDAFQVLHISDRQSFVASVTTLAAGHRWWQLYRQTTELLGSEPPLLPDLSPETSKRATDMLVLHQRS